MQLMCSPVGLRRQLGCVNVCPAVSQAMIRMLMYDLGLGSRSANEPPPRRALAATSPLRVAGAELVVSGSDLGAD